MKKNKRLSCKLGTQPALIWVKGGRKAVKLGRIQFREYDGEPWQTGIVDRIGPDGYFFVEKF